MTEQLRVKKEFSQDDRARLRAALLAYMEEHRIGVPTLQVRIAQAAGREPHLLPLKTLQRFLADTSRTNDGLLSLCFQFAETLEPKAGPEGFAEAADAFFETTVNGGNRSVLLGRWTGLAQRNKTGMSVVNQTGMDISSVQTSELKLELLENGKGLKTTEKVTNPGGNRNAKYDPGMQHIYEGIAVQFRPLICLIAKNLLTRLPRTYWLQESDTGFLIGHGAEAIFGVREGDKKVVSDLAHFRFERMTREQ
jgi:hypothetical protein